MVRSNIIELAKLVKSDSESLRDASQILTAFNHIFLKSGCSLLLLFLEVYHSTRNEILFLLEVIELQDLLEEKSVGLCYARISLTL